MLTRLMLPSMIALQILWLLAILVTGRVNDQPALAWLLAGTVGVGAAALWTPSTAPGWLSRLPRVESDRGARLRWVMCPVVFAVAIAYAIYQGTLPDEPFMLAAARTVASRGVGSFLEQYGTFRVIGRQHPPLMPVLYGLVMRGVGDHPAMLRAVPVLFLVLTLIVTYRLGSELYDRRSGTLAAVLLLALPYVLRWGTALSTDMAVTFFFSLALLLTVRLSTRPSVLLAVAAGATIGLGILTKYTMILVFPVLIGYPLIVGRLRRSIPYLAVMAAVAAAVVLPWAVYAYSSGVLALQTRRMTTFSRIVTHSSAARPRMLGFALMNLPSGIGVFNLPVLAIGLWGAVRAPEPPGMFLLLWVALVWGVLLAMLPDPRYFMVTFPALAILMARTLAATPRPSGRAIVLAFFFCASALYLYVGALRAAPSSLVH